LRDIIPEVDLKRILKNPTKDEMLEELDEVIGMAQPFRGAEKSRSNMSPADCSVGMI